MKSLMKKVDDPIIAKYAHQPHQQKMAAITLKGKEVVLKQAKQKKANLEAKILYQRKEFQAWTYEQQDLQKHKELEKKEEDKEKTQKFAGGCLRVVSSDMLRTNHINGGALPSPGLSLQAVSSCRVPSLCFQFTCSYILNFS
jgi:hypothetical protein